MVTTITVMKIHRVDEHTAGVMNGDDYDSKDDTGSMDKLLG